MKWEYLKLDLNALSRSESELDALNHVGAQGWELVFINSCNIAILKRGIPAPKTTRATTSIAAREKQT